MAKTALALGLAACQKGLTVAFRTAAALVSQLMEARDERRLLKLQRDLAAVKLLIIDGLGYVPLSPTGAELLFKVFSQRYERGPTIVTSNLPFAARPADASRQHPHHERRQLPTEAVFQPPPLRRQGGAKPSHRDPHPDTGEITTA